MTKEEALLSFNATLAFLMIYYQDCLFTTNVYLKCGSLEISVHIDNKEKDVDNFIDKMKGIIVCGTKVYQHDIDKYNTTVVTFDFAFNPHT